MVESASTREVEIPEVSEEQARSDIKSGLLRNSAMMVGSRLIAAGTALLAVPFIVSRIGLAGFGTWEAITAIGSLLSIPHQAVNGTYLWRVSNAHGVSDYDKIRHMMRFASAIILILLVLLVPGIYFLRHGVVAGFKDITPTLAAGVLWVLPAYIALYTLSGFNDILVSTISGCQHTGLANLTQSISSVVNYGVAIVMLIKGYGLASMLFGFAAGAAFAFVTLCFLSIRKARVKPIFLPAWASKDEIGTLRKYWSLLIVGYGSQSLRDQTDKVVLTHFAGTDWTGNYGIALRIANLVMDVSRFFYIPLLSAAGSLHARGDWAGVQRLYSTVVVMVCAAAGVVVVLISGMAPDWLVLWMGHQVYDKHGVNMTGEIMKMFFILITGNAFAVVLTGPGTAVCRAVGKVHVETYYVVINLFSNLMLTIALVLLIGPIGTVIATGSTWALSSVIFSILLPKFVDIPRSAINISRKYLALIVACSGLVYFVDSRFPMTVTRMEAAQHIGILAGPSVLLFLFGAVQLKLLSAETISRYTARVRGRFAR